MVFVEIFLWLIVEYGNYCTLPPVPSALIVIVIVIVVVALAYLSMVGVGGCGAVCAVVRVRVRVCWVHRRLPANFATYYFFATLSPHSLPAIFVKMEVGIEDDIILLVYHYL